MTMSIEHFRFSTEMLRRLGEELNPHPDQGILELVRNAYDADAATCSVQLVDTQRAGGSILITDDGNGMSPEEIRSGWLIIGKSAKAPRKPTQGRGRLPVGNKGIGRLSALRLGRIATLTTRPRGEPRTEYRLRIDWNSFDQANVVEEVPLQVESQKRRSGDPPGTFIQIEELRDSLSKSDVKRLARAMILLADPFASPDPRVTEGAFRPVLKAPEFEELESLVSRRYFDEAEYYLVAKLDEKGRASAIVKDYANEVVFRANHKELCADKDRPKYKAPPAEFELWMYLLGGKRDFSVRTVSLSELKSWLGEVGGVHLYHRGMRVHPYSDLDWLDMNLSRVRSPELRPSTNNSIGRVAVGDPNGLLLPKTDRVGFIENESFHELRRFAIDALEWVAERRLEQREQRREGAKVETAREVQDAKKAIDHAVEAVPTKERERVRTAISEYEGAMQREENLLREDLQLYRTLCTVGATTAAFAHQAKSPLAHIVSSAGSLEDYLGPGASRIDSRILREMAGDIRTSADSLLSFAKVTLGLLQHEKRRRGAVSIHSVIEEMEILFRPYLKLREVILYKDFGAEKCSVLASRAALESIVANLTINSLAAFCESTAQERKLVFRTRNVKKLLQLTVLDNGPGIKGLSAGDVWLPGKTTTREGTGLGLTIVKDIVMELGGSVHAIPRGDLGGAEFVIDLPARGA
jgi:signal transduction histidine kinase